MLRRDSHTLDSHILNEAADWLMRLSEGNVNDAERHAWERWRASSPAHSEAWARAELLLSKLQSLPPALAMPALDRPGNPERRAAMGKLAALLALAPLAWGSWKLNEWQQWTADYRAPVGERRDLTLNDGTLVTLNTDTAIDVYFDSHQRLLLLRRGEILIQTAADPSPVPRPFKVQTEQGRMQALGTRFSVREETGHTRLAVMEGAVRIELKGLEEKVVSAGQSSGFTAFAIDAVKPVDKSALAWTRGMLMADNMRLADFIDELARYRNGVLRCDPAIANLRISGAFPINDTRRTLNMLTQTYPINVTSRLGDYWLMLAPA
ncbi:FecR domain-containing protein [Pseudomonas uvaldensis]|uniref:FecR domain-containing protein n=1 Tax=Pseudomonas uvaldensis TaxID=2878385 RepID=UPI001E5EF62F|nr:FecR domain-containing protein [Pseudomonas uvaldensis]MCE0460809.1 FecR domain-containing protein [Pseudomonas uvaldensis]